MLKATATSITPAVTQLFNISIKTGELPADWKLVLITPIPKSGDKSDPNNSWPISLLSILSKLLEKHIYSRIMKHIEEQSPISEKQWGFMKGKATTGALLTAVESWHRHLESGSDICAIFFDFKKVFDSVSHNLLLNKLSALGVDLYLLKWVANYLMHQLQYTLVLMTKLQAVYRFYLESHRDWSWAPCCFCNDIATLELSDGSLILYADDLLLYQAICSDSDYELLQKNIDKLYIWSDENHLCFNPNKCKYNLIRSCIKETESIPTNHKFKY